MVGCLGTLEVFLYFFIFSSSLHSAVCAPRDFLLRSVNFTSPLWSWSLPLGIWGNGERGWWKGEQYNAAQVESASQSQGEAYQEARHPMPAMLRWSGVRTQPRSSVDAPSASRRLPIPELFWVMLAEAPIADLWRLRQSLLSRSPLFWRPSADDNFRSAAG